jgi:cell division protein FtsQ
MVRKGYSDDEPAPRPRAIPLRAGTGDADENAPGNGINDAPGSRVVDLEDQQESPFLRAQKRVPVRRGALPRKAANQLKYLLLAMLALALVALVVTELKGYSRSSWRFRLDSSDLVQLTGNQHVSRAQVIEVFRDDISHNVFLIPLEDRKRQLEKIPWVESATVMRLLPNRVRVEVRERIPIAYVQTGTHIRLADSDGVLMDAPPGTRYSFPVILGFTGREPLSTRVARMSVYQTLVGELDSGGANYARDLSEVDLSDPEDLKVTVSDSHGEVLVHLGSSNFLDRYKVYVAHVQEWRQQFQRLDSVDLRYDRQVIVNPDNRAEAAQPSAPVAVVRPAPDPHVVVGAHSKRSPKRHRR